MFGKNEIVGKKYFKDADGKYLVTSVFYTIQGEGPLAGKPATFVRLSKCNLNCSFCDTYFDSGDWYTLKEVVDLIETTENRYFNEWTPDWLYETPPAVILSGGEPTLQIIYPLLSALINKGRLTQIESNGILEVVVPNETVVVISPKVSEKTGKYLDPHPATMARADCLKFVVSADPNSPYHTVPDWAHTWSLNHGDVYVSPMNIYNEEPQAAKTARNSNSTSLEQRSTVEEVIDFWTPGLLNLTENEKNHKWAARMATTYGFRLNLQMHLYAGAA